MVRNLVEDVRVLRPGTAGSRAGERVTEDGVLYRVVQVWRREPTEGDRQIWDTGPGDLMERRILTREPPA